MMWFRHCAWIALGLTGSLAGQENPTGKAVESEKPAEAGTQYANRLIIYPLTSYFINGLNGKIERRFANPCL